MKILEILAAIGLIAIIDKTVTITKKILRRCKKLRRKLLKSRERAVRKSILKRVSRIDIVARNGPFFFFAA